MQPVVLDTNIVLDLFVFHDATVSELLTAIDSQQVTWLATPAMRDELATVLSYPQLGAYLAAAQESPAHVLEMFDRHAQGVSAPAPAIARCRDADDQKFIDLAVARRATLLSRDKDILALRRRLAKMDVTVARTLPPATASP